MIVDFFRVTPKRRKVKLKRKNGVLFSNPSGWKRQVFYVGDVLFVLAVCFGVYIYWPVGNALVRFWFSQASEPTPLKTGYVVLEPTPMPLKKEARINEYDITIPKIMAFAKIVDNVSPFDKKQYTQVLQDNVVAQAKDTSPPGMGPGHTTYIFAHSTSGGINMVRKNAVFYLLGEMKNGDEFFINKNGKNYAYKVYQQKIISADQTDFLKYTDPEKEVVILQTCWPIGTDWKRLLVFAEPE